MLSFYNMDIWLSYKFKKNQKGNTLLAYKINIQTEKKKENEQEKERRYHIALV